MQMDQLNSTCSQLASSKTHCDYILSLLNVNGIFLLQKMKVVLLALVLSFAAVAYSQTSQCVTTLAGLTTSGCVASYGTAFATVSEWSTSIKCLKLMMYYVPVGWCMVNVFRRSL